METAFPNNSEDKKKFFTFIYLAMVLALITGIEIVLIWIPLATWFLITTLALLSVVKFLAVVWWFMHMRWDRALIAVLFFLGILIGGGTAVVLWALFVWDSHAPDWETQQLAQLEVPAVVQTV